MNSATDTTRAPPPTPTTVASKSPHAASRWTHRKPSMSVRETRERKCTPQLVFSATNDSSSPALSLSTSSSSLSIAPSLASSSSSSCRIFYNSQSAPVSPKKHATLSPIHTPRTVPITRFPSLTSPSSMSLSETPAYSSVALPERIAARPTHSGSIVMPPAAVGSGPVRARAGVTGTHAWIHLELTAHEIQCPRCHSSNATVPVGHWRERRELVLLCSAFFIEPSRPEGYRICGAQWTPSEPVAVCECGTTLEIECHHRHYIYLCPACHSMSHTSRNGDPPGIANNDMS